MSSDQQHQETQTRFEIVKYALVTFGSTILVIQSSLFFAWDQFRVMAACSMGEASWVYCSFGRILFCFHFITAATPFLLKPLQIFDISGRIVRTCAALALLALALFYFSDVAVAIERHFPTLEDKKMIFEQESLPRAQAFKAKIIIIHFYIAAVNFVLAGILLLKRKRANVP